MVILGFLSSWVTFGQQNFQSVQVSDEEEAEALSAAESLRESAGDLGSGVHGGCGCKSSQERLTTS